MSLNYSLIKFTNKINLLEEKINSLDIGCPLQRKLKIQKKLLQSQVKKQMDLLKKEGYSINNNKNRRKLK